MTLEQAKALAAVCAAAKPRARYKQVRDAFENLFDQYPSHWVLYGHLKSLRRRGLVRIEPIPKGRRNDNWYMPTKGARRDSLYKDLLVITGAIE